MHLAFQVNTGLQQQNDHQRFTLAPQRQVKCGGYGVEIQCWHTL